MPPCRLRRNALSPNQRPPDNSAVQHCRINAVDVRQQAESQSPSLFFSPITNTTSFSHPPDFPLLRRLRSKHLIPSSAHRDRHPFFVSARRGALLFSVLTTAIPRAFVSFHFEYDKNPQSVLGKTSREQTTPRHLRSPTCPSSSGRSLLDSGYVAIPVSLWLRPILRPTPSSIVLLSECSGLLCTRPERFV